MGLRKTFLIIGLVVLIAALGFSFTAANAIGRLPLAGAPSSSLPADVDNAACLKCHGNQQFNTTLGIQKKDVFDLSVDQDTYNHSVHGQIGITCVGCHIGFEAKSGHGLVFNSRREVTLKLNAVCGECHKQQGQQQKDSVHSSALASGMLEAAQCTDCHSAHAVKRLKDQNTGQLLPETRTWIPLTCEKCHSAIYEKYKTSVHGAALTNGNNPDVPTCIDCHGVHSIEDPTTSAFRLASPQVCAKCHTDPNRMDKYGISTQVLNTYVSDFHGTTVTIFSKTSPDSVTNKPVCYDCHGVHDIVKVDDPQRGLSIKTNLLKTCQKCHPNANINFPDAWLSHYIPSANEYPVVYYINLFYTFLIPGVLIPMGVLVVMDFGRMMINRFTKPKSSSASKKSATHNPTDQETHHG